MVIIVVLRSVKMIHYHFSYSRKRNRIARIRPLIYIVRIIPALQGIVLGDFAAILDYHDVEEVSYGPWIRTWHGFANQTDSR